MGRRSDEFRRLLGTKIPAAPSAALRFRLLPFTFCVCNVQLCLFMLRNARSKNLFVFFYRVSLKDEVRIYGPESKRFLRQIEIGGNRRAVKVVMVTDAR